MLYKIFFTVVVLLIGAAICYKRRASNRETRSMNSTTIVECVATEATVAGDDEASTVVEKPVNTSPVVQTTAESKTVEALEETTKDDEDVTFERIKFFPPERFNSESFHTSSGNFLVTGTDKEGGLSFVLSSAGLRARPSTDSDSIVVGRVEIGFACGCCTPEKTIINIFDEMKSIGGRLYFFAVEDVLSSEQNLIIPSCVIRTFLKGEQKRNFLLENATMERGRKIMKRIPEAEDFFLFGEAPPVPTFLFQKETEERYCERILEKLKKETLQKMDADVASVSVLYCEIQTLENRIAKGKNAVASAEPGSAAHAYHKKMVDKMETDLRESKKSALEKECALVERWKLPVASVYKDAEAKARIGEILSIRSSAYGFDACNPFGPGSSICLFEKKETTNAGDEVRTSVIFLRGRYFYTVVVSKPNYGGITATTTEDFEQMDANALAAIVKHQEGMSQAVAQSS